jgi:hypothetical protein
LLVSSFSNPEKYTFVSEDVTEQYPSDEFLFSYKPHGPAGVLLPKNLPEFRNQRPLSNVVLDFFDRADRSILKQPDFSFSANRHLLSDDYDFYNGFFAST